MLNSNYYILDENKKMKLYEEGTWMYTGYDYNLEGINGVDGLWSDDRSIVTKFPYKEVCFSCTSSARPVLTIRGLCSGSGFDTRITFSLNEDGYVEYFGEKNSFINFDYENNVWIMTSLPFPRAIAKAEAAGQTLGLGSKTWVVMNDQCGKKHVEKVLKITSCI